MTGPARRSTYQQLKMVQELIERCLRLYMTKKEVVEALLTHVKVAPQFTELVWRRLELENRAFFQSYYLLLSVKQQITEFSNLVEQQVRIRHQLHPARVSSIYNCNGPHLSQMPQSSSGYAPENTGKALEQENMLRPMGSCLPPVFGNDSSSLYNGPNSHIELPTHASTIDAQSDMLSTRSSNMGLMQGINRNMVNSEPVYSGSSAYMFGAQSNVLEARTTIGDANSNSVEPSTQPLNDPFLDADISSFGLGLSDLAADLSHSSDIQKNYTVSPFSGTYNGSLQDSCEREQQGYNERLESMSEGLCYNGYRMNSAAKAMVPFLPNK